MVALVSWRTNTTAVSGTSPAGKLVEVIEIASLSWFIACQFHPELKSRPLAPAPLFASFIEAATCHAGLVGQETEAAIGTAD